MRTSFDILVIEDQTKHQKIFAETLEHELEANVRFAMTGEDGIKSITNDKKPDLVVLDLDLPGISGQEVLQRLKSDFRTRLIPVIVLTGSSSQLVEMELLENGAEDYLEKGSHPDILVSRIRAQIRHKKAIDRLQQLAINRDMFAAGVLANISSARKALNEQADAIKMALGKDPVVNTEKVLTIMDQMCEQASRLGQFASDVIQSVRDTHRTAVPKAIGLKDFVERVNAYEAQKDVKDEKAKKVQLNIKGHLGTVLVDPDYFRILVMNLLENVAKRTTSKTEKIEVDVQELPWTDTKETAMTKLILRDFGQSIAEGDLPNLFEPHISEQDGHDPTFDISLAVVSSIVRKIDGEIWAEAPKNNGQDQQGGVEFHLLLPKA